MPRAIARLIDHQSFTGAFAAPLLFREALVAKEIERVAPALAVFGLDASKKAHGSYFGQDEVDRAIKAAFDMGMFAVRIVNDELAAIAAKLPRGKLFDSGNAFVPFTSGKLFEQLRLAAEATAGAGEGTDGVLLRPATPAADRPRKPASKPANAGGGASKRQPVPPMPYTVPASWGEIGIGSLVLVIEGKEDGYFPAIVQSVGDEVNIEDRQLQLRFRDYPDYPAVVRKLTEVGLVHPASTSHLPDASK